MECNRVRERLSCYLDGALDEATLEAIEAHLEHCEDCLAELKVLRAVVKLTSLVADVESPAYLSASIREAISRERETAVTCEDCLPLLSGYADEELSPADAAMVEAHTASCSFCADELAALGRVVSVMGTVTEVAPPATLRGRIAAATTGNKPVVRWNRARIAMERLFLVPKAGWAGAAAAAGIVAVMLILSRDMTPVPPQIAPPRPVSPPVTSVAPDQAEEAAVPPVVNTKLATPLPRSQFRVPAGEPVRVAGVIRHGFPERVVMPVGNPKSPVKDEKPVATPEPPTTTATPNEDSPAPKTTDTGGDKPTLVVEKPDEPRDSVVTGDEGKLMKIAVSAPKQTADYSDYFKNVKSDAEMKQRPTREVSVDVISGRF